MSDSPKTSEDPSEEDFLDLERDLPTSPEDVEALRRARRSPVSPKAYAAFLKQLGHLSIEDLRRRKGPRGEPFELL